MIRYKKKRLIIPSGLGNSVCDDAVTINYQNKTVDSSTVAQHITYDPSYNALGYVDVLPYVAPSGNIVLTRLGQADVSLFATAEIDDTGITAENIKKGVEILGITGTYENIPYLQMKIVDSSTRWQTVYPDAGYDGLEYIRVQPYYLENKSVSVTENGKYTYMADHEEGMKQIIVDVSVQEQLPEQAKSVDSSTVSQTVTPDQGYALSQVTVNPYTTEQRTLTLSNNGSYVIDPSNADAISQLSLTVSVDTRLPEQAKTIDPSTSEQVVLPDTGYVLNRVTINPVTSAIDPDILPSNIKSGVNILGVTGTVTELNAGPVILDSSTLQQVVNPPAGYNSISEVTVRPYTLETKTVNPSTGSQYITADNADALAAITVTPVTSSIDPNITASNIKSGVNILGVTGTVTELNAGPVILDSSTSRQVVSPPIGYNAISEVTVAPYTLESSTLDPSTVLRTITPYADGFSSVILNPVTSSIDSNISSFNIKSGVTILGVTGNVEELKGETVSADSSTNRQTITPDPGYNGITSLTIEPYDPSAIVQQATSDATATDQQIFLGYSAYVNGVKVNGSFDYDTVDDDIDDILGNSVNHMQSKTVDSSVVLQTVTADSGYVALSQVTVNPYDPSTVLQELTSDATASASDIMQGETAYVNGSLITGTHVDSGLPTQSKTVNSSTNSQTVLPDSGYTLSDVTVNPYSLQSKTATAAPYSTQTITPDAGYNGLSSVTVNPILIETGYGNSSIGSQWTVYTPQQGYFFDSFAVYPLTGQAKTVNSSTNAQTITPDTGYDCLTSVTVNPLLAQYKTVNSSTASQRIDPSDGYDVLSYVIVNPIATETKSVTPSTSSQTINPTSGKVITRVNVSAVSSSIDSNISAGNIKSGVTILGVTGTYSGSAQDWDTVYNALNAI